MEADLQRFYAIDYRDRWRGSLSLRRIHALVRNLPPESSVSTIQRGGEPYWSLEAHLLDNIRMALTGTKEKPAVPYPGRFPAASRPDSPERKRKLAAARERARERRRQLKASKET